MVDWVFICNCYGSVGGCQGVAMELLIFLINHFLREVSRVLGVHHKKNEASVYRRGFVVLHHVVITWRMQMCLSE